VNLVQPPLFVQIIFRSFIGSPSTSVDKNSSHCNLFYRIYLSISVSSVDSVAKEFWSKRVFSAQKKKEEEIS
jgi:hypothetical protein